MGSNAEPIFLHDDNSKIEIYCSCELVVRSASSFSNNSVRGAKLTESEATAIAFGTLRPRSAVQTRTSIENWEMRLKRRKDTSAIMRAGARVK